MQTVTYTIEKGVPLLSKTGARVEYVSRYPFAEMEIGDSVFFAGNTQKSTAVQTARSFGKKHDKKFTSRSVDGGVRVWRVA